MYSQQRAHPLCEGFIPGVWVSLIGRYLTVGFTKALHKIHDMSFKQFGGGNEMFS